MMKIVIIPFDVDLSNPFDKDVYIHAKDTIKKLPECINTVFIYRSYDNFKDEISKYINNKENSQESPDVEIYIVSHGTIYTMGNDNEKQLYSDELCGIIKNIIKIFNMWNNLSIYLFSCNSGIKLVYEIGKNINNNKINIYGIDGYIGYVKGKKHIYVSDILGGPARYRYTQKLIKYDGKL